MFERQCPSCGKTHTYSSKSNLNAANRIGRLCNGCARAANWKTPERRAKVRSFLSPQEWIVEGEIATMTIHDCHGAEAARVVIDAADVPFCQQHRWCFSKGTRRVRTSRTPKQLLYRMLLDPIPDGLQVDHCDGDVLNNRRSNLRLVTSGQQRENVVRQNMHGHRNVVRHVRGDTVRYYAKVSKQGQQFCGPKRLTPEEAAEDARQLRAQHFTHHNEDRH